MSCKTYAGPGGSDLLLVHGQQFWASSTGRMKSNFVCCGSFAWWLKTTSVTFMVLHLLHVSSGLQATHALYLAAVTLLLLALDFLDVFLIAVFAIEWFMVIL